MCFTVSTNTIISDKTDFIKIDQEKSIYSLDLVFPLNYRVD